MTQGLWVISGLLAFLLLEKMFPDQEDSSPNSDLNFNSAVSISAARGRVSTSKHIFFFFIAEFSSDLIHALSAYFCLWYQCFGHRP